MVRMKAAERAKFATVHRPGPPSNQAYPIRPGNRQDARDALARIDQAKPPLTPSQKSAVTARANAVLGKKKGK